MQNYLSDKNSSFLLMESFQINSQIKKIIKESSELIKNSTILIPEIEKAIMTITISMRNGNKLLIFGNGGSAADAEHMAAEFLGRFNLKRKSYPAIALTSNSSTNTSISNDFSFDDIFSRQCESLVKKGDVVMGISTSGNSMNVQKGLITAKKKGAITIGLLGNDGGIIKKFADNPIIVNSTSTPRIQEVHRTILHIICEIVEKNLKK